MSARQEGINSFSNFDSLKIQVFYPNSKRVKSVSLRFGGIIECLEDSYNRVMKLHNHNLRNFFYRRSKDGYYKEKFIFIEHLNENFKERNKGLVFYDVNLFLEEPYDRQFLGEYFKDLFDGLQKVYDKNDLIKSYQYQKNRQLA